MSEGKYFKAEAIDYKGQLKKISKSKNKLQPLLEALTNSIEAIKLENNNQGTITIQLKFKNNLIVESELSEIIFIDNGIGFDDENFRRFKRLHDESKNFFNHGSGRIQYIHFFDEINIESIYKDSQSKTEFYKRTIVLSKSKVFLNNNSIMKYYEPIEENIKETSTTVVLKRLLDKNDQVFYDKLTANKLKKEIITHYLDYFSENRDTFPNIVIQKFVDNNEIEKVEINSNDIETEDKTEEIEIYYKKLSDNGKQILKTEKKEIFEIKAFKLNKNILSSNSLKLTSKHEIVEGKIAKEIKLDILKDDDVVNSNRYLFLISSEYINKKDNDVRGDIEIYTEEKFKNDSSLFQEKEVILLDDIQNKVNNHILSMYNEIREMKDKQQLDIDKLQEMFLLNKTTLKNIKINIQDTDESILKKVYKADAQIIAEKDAKIKEQIDTLNKLNPTADNYQNDLEAKASSLVNAIPLQNKIALTHYIARRKLVLDLFDKILNKELTRQQKGNKNINEKLLHNLIFQQSSDNPEESDLWLMNEDFIYYKGSSESTLGDIEIEDNSIIKDELTEEEIAYKLKQQGDASRKRPDVLLFPNEGKCILIEFKAPNVNVSEHLNQLNRYASLINNLSKDIFKFTTYYGYLVGENIDIDDIVDNDSDFMSAHSLDYIFRPYKRIAGKFEKNDGSLYTEIIKYSTILERAKRRNKIFIDKLMGNSK